ncbi:hypothetical protein MUA90_12465 [Staphylococcus sp. IVB6181]|uniref:hypothetical protein n=1 Tax=Staphylococcus sp. IVB6181 TaxID=2929481 RepID=UPI0021D1B207|nr:hypothetical protein [Staphylococcus sp. IVB6181]UXV34805.1 hypothetical protein MUA90_12465 [Staphylococcus sp. IVB6181]
MLTIKLLEKNKSFVTYNYFPEDRSEEYQGKVTIRLADRKVVDATKSGLGGYYSIYLGHAIQRIKENIENNEFPETDFVAWW